MSNAPDAVAVQPTKEIAPRPAQAWSYWPYLLIVLPLLYLYWDIAGNLFRAWWDDPNFSHGFFVPLFSLYVVWIKRDRLRKVAIRPSWFGLVFMAGALCILIVGVLGAELFLSRSSLIFLISGMVIYFLGWQYLRALLFPLLFLFLMIPIPAIIFNQITFPLQILSSKLASNILPIFGVPVLREGNVIQLPAMPLEVAEACSGIRSLMSLGTLAIIYGYFLDSQVWRRLLLAVCAIPIAVAANAFRVVGTGLMVQYWNPDKALGFFHEFSGWVIFMVAVCLLVGVHAVIRMFGKREANA